MRRIVVAGIAIGLFAAATPLPGQTERTVTKLSEGTYEIEHRQGGGGNTTVIIGDRQVFVVDTCFLPSAAREDIAQIRQWTNKPVSFVLNTHFHNDHNFGNRIYMDAFPALTIIAQVETKKEMDAIQYTPVLNTGRNWQIYNGPGFTGAVDIPKDVWFHLRLEVTGAQAKLYVKDMDKPVLVMDDLKSGVQKGQLALYTLTGETYFSNFEVRTTAEAPWQRHLPAMQPNILTKWSISPSYDALQRNLERPLGRAESEGIHWQDVEAEPPGFVVLYRYREAPHPRVTFQGDFSKRLEPQPGMKVLYARTSIDSDREQVKKLEIGYSDDVSVFLNGKILYRGRSAQGFRDPGFLGIVNPENDAVYLPLKKGRNELMLAVSELGGGWGFICRLADLEN
jgi:NADH:ubiquinone oxidoreductase subunit